MPRSPKTVPDGDDADSRARLLHEAERLFMAHGFAAVSTRQICEAARVTQPSLYHYFSSKEGLYLAVIERWFEALRVRILAVIAQGATLRAQLHGVALIFWQDVAGEYQAMQRDAMTYIPAEHRPQLGQTVWRCVVQPLITLMQAGVASGDLPALDPFILTELFWAVVDGIGGIYLRGDPMPTPQTNLAPIDFFLAGIRGVAPATFANWPQPGAGFARLFITEDPTH